MNNIDSHELDKFEDLANEWWDSHGKLRTLHHINPTRLRYIESATPLKGKKVLDLGCGGGLLTEAMADRGAELTGLDASIMAIDVAKQHQQHSGYDINYVCDTAENFARENRNQFDIITCMELLEHIPDAPSLIAACNKLLQPGGHLILSTINRNLKAYLLSIVGAEYILGLLPKGTHQYEKFIKPSELSTWLRKGGFTVIDLAGMRYLPGVEHCTITNTPSVNYLVHAKLVD